MDTTVDSSNPRVDEKVPRLMSREPASKQNSILVFLVYISVFFFSRVKGWSRGNDSPERVRPSFPELPIVYPNLLRIPSSPLSHPPTSSFIAPQYCPHVEQVVGHILVVIPTLEEDIFVPGHTNTSSSLRTTSATPTVTSRTFSPPVWSSQDPNSPIPLRMSSSFP